MAEEQAQKTEQPTPRRVEKAREEGQVASSKDLTMALQFGAATLLLMMFSPLVIEGLARTMRGTFQFAFREAIRRGELESLAAAATTDSLAFLTIPATILLLIGLLMHMAQTGFLISVKKLAPDFKRLNPVSKIKELPSENLSQTGKALLLLPIMGALLWYILSSQLETFLTLPKMALPAGSAVLGRSILTLLGQAALALIALGALDLFRQRRRVRKRLMMSKQEVRQEQKDTDGNPHIKARMRRMQRELMRKRMMSKVPEATIVVTNPTHYAVALKYEPETMAAPLVLAKGLDFLALRIRRKAEEHEIPIVENPPLAQALYRGAEVGQEIPAELYRAVAEILAYIYRLKGRR